jgi:hypothetical protein
LQSKIYLLNITALKPLVRVCTIRANALEVIDSRRVKMVDLVGIEPTTSSMPWNEENGDLVTAKDLIAGPA